MTQTITGPGSTQITETDSDMDFYTIVGTSEAPPCEVPSGCEEVAKYACTLKCCGRLVLICEPHFDGVLERLHAWLTQGIKARCLWCNGTIADAKPFAHVERV